MTTHISHNHPSLKEWLIVCLKIGALSFGGAGRAMLVRDIIVHDKKWLTNDEFHQIYTIASVLPGSNISNLSAYIGYKLLGNLGGILGVLALVAPGALLALIILLFVPIDQPDIAKFFLGFSIASIAIFAVFIAQLFVGIKGHHLSGPLPRLKYVLRILVFIFVAISILSGVSFLLTLVSGLILCLLTEFLA